MKRALCTAAAWATALLFFFVILLPHSEQAAAQSGQRADRHKLDVIRDRMEKGQALFAAGNYAAAAEVFEAAHAEQPYAAFLFNAGVCYQKLGNNDQAVAKFKGYLAAAPDAPDAAKVKSRVAALEASLGVSPTPAPEAGPGEDAGAEGGVVDAGVPSDAATPSLPLGLDTSESMKSLALIETEPPGAPVKLYQRTSASAPEFKLGGENPGWSEITASRSPANLTLEVGQYHVVVEPYLDFRACEADIDVKRAKVFHFRANLSQGEFMSFLRVAANVQGAYVFIDDDRRQRPPWGVSPHGELLSSGDHTLLVEAPGFEPYHRKLRLGRGEQKEVEVKLVRVAFGLLRLQGNSPELKIQVDEKAMGIWRQGEAPLDVKLDAGKHKLTIKASGYKTYQGMIEVPRGQVLPLEVEMVPTYPRGAAWTQAIIGAVFIGAGTYFGLASNDLHSELENDRKNGVLEKDDERIKRGRLYAIGADAGFVIGGILAGFATYNFIKDPYPDSKVSPRKLVEFDDPRKARPTAMSPWRRRPRVARPPAKPSPLGLRAGPMGLSLGGSF